MQDVDLLPQVKRLGPKTIDVPAVEVDGVLGLRAVVDGRVEVVDEGVDVGVRVLHLERRPLRVHVVGADGNTAADSTFL